MVYEEGMGSSESGDEEEVVGGITIVQTFNDDLKEEISRQMKHDEGETKGSAPKEEQEGGKAVEDTELPTEEKLMKVVPPPREGDIEEDKLKEHGHEDKQILEEKGKEIKIEESPQGRLTT